MKIKTSALIGPALDWAVAKCEGADGSDLDPMAFSMNRNAAGMWDYSSDWSQGGPIIDNLVRRGLRIHGMKCRYITDVTSVTVDINGHYQSRGPTPLIAAMRCYVASKMGDEIETPEELK